MSTSDQNQSKPAQGGEQGHGAETSATPQAESAGAERGGRHGRRRHGRPEQRRQQPGGQQQQPQRRTEATLNMEELRELTELFSAHKLTDFEFENAEIRVRLSRNPSAPAGAGQPAPHAQPQPAAAHGAAAANAPAPAAQAGAAEESAAEKQPPPAEEELHIITSPIVGTFYRSPSPTAEPFIRIGSTVDPDMVVCIIEAMKLMNEIQAETSGTVAKIYVENGQAVEYGQPLFGIKK